MPRFPILCLFAPAQGGRFCLFVWHQYSLLDFFLINSELLHILFVRVLVLRVSRAWLSRSKQEQHGSAAASTMQPLGNGQPPLTSAPQSKRGESISIGTGYWTVNSSSLPPKPKLKPPLVFTAEPVSCSCLTYNFQKAISVFATGDLLFPRDQREPETHRDVNFTGKPVTLLRVHFFSLGPDFS